MSVFPSTRLRRNRKSEWSRRLIAENRLDVSDLIWPVFLIEGQNERETIELMPNVERLSIDLAIKAIQQAFELGIQAVALFAKLDRSLCDDSASYACKADNLICRAVKSIKDKVPQIGIICDVALDGYTSHGHDGIMDKKGRIDNDRTIEILVRQSLVQAQAGCDVLAPSDMMDGRIGAIRLALEQDGYYDTQILSYTAKYASCFYGPFRHALGSIGRLKGDKKTYQMDCANVTEAIAEAELDIDEGADMLMVKPAMPYLDVIKTLSERFTKPVFAYQVSAEYAMLHLGAQNGAYRLSDAVYESLMGCKRAGAHAILTYFATYFAKNINS